MTFPSRRGITVNGARLLCNARSRYRFVLFYWPTVPGRFSENGTPLVTAESFRPPHFSYDGGKKQSGSESGGAGNGGLHAERQSSVIAETHRKPATTRRARSASVCMGAASAG